MIGPRYIPWHALALILSGTSALRADWLLDDARQRVLAQSPAVKALADEIRQARPGFAMSLSREELPTMIQLRSSSPDRYSGIVNVAKAREKVGVMELAVAGLYFMARADVIPGNSGNPRAVLAFLGRVLKELKHADPGRYGKVPMPRTWGES